MKNIKLIATDLDGTLITQDDEQDLYDAFRDVIDDFRRNTNCVWAICTGRDMKHFRRVFLLMEHYGVMPDYVILKHAYIYRIVRGRYVPHAMWNLKIRAEIRDHQRGIARTLRELHALVTDRFDSVRTIALQKDRLCMRFRDNRDSAAASKVLQEHVKKNSLLNLFEYHGEVDIRVVPSTKGKALQQLAAHLGIPSDSVLAIGDGHNDLAIMVPDVAAHTGCPANAKEEIIEAVHLANGHVARAQGLAGSMEVLKAYATDTVNSELPEAWTRTADSDNPVAAPPARPRMRHSRQEKFQRTQQIKALWLLGVGGYMTAIIFAHFNLLPFSRLILMPYTIIMKLIAKTLDYASMVF